MSRRIRLWHFVLMFEIVGLALIAGLVLVTLWATGYFDQVAACDRLGGEMHRSACVLPSGEYVDPMVYQKGQSK